MSTVNFAPTVVIESPEGLDLAVEQLRKLLFSDVSWVTKAYHLAQRFRRKENGRTFYYPQTYVSRKSGERDYQRLTPDSLAQGMLFFIAGDGRANDSLNEQGYMDYEVGLIFSTNLELIDKDLLDTGLYTQNMMHQVHKVLRKYKRSLSSSYDVIGESRDLRRVYREFTLDDIEDYNTAPLQVFRIDLKFKIEIPC